MRTALNSPLFGHLQIKVLDGSGSASKYGTPQPGKATALQAGFEAMKPYLPEDVKISRKDWVVYEPFDGRGAEGFRNPPSIGDPVGTIVGDIFTVFTQTPEQDRKISHAISALGLGVSVETFIDEATRLNKIMADIFQPERTSSSGILLQQTSDIKAQKPTSTPDLVKRAANIIEAIGLEKFLTALGEADGTPAPPKLVQDLAGKIETVGLEKFLMALNKTQDNRLIKVFQRLNPNLIKEAFEKPIQTAESISSSTLDPPLQNKLTQVLKSVGL